MLLLLSTTMPPGAAGQPVVKLEDGLHGEYLGNEYAAIRLPELDRPMSLSPYTLGSPQTNHMLPEASRAILGL